MMPGAWNEWEGTLINDEFPLHRLLGSGPESAAFLTQIGGAEPRNATIKLVLADAAGEEEQLARWRRAAELSHPNVVRIVDSGVCQPQGSGLLYVVMEHADETLAGVLQQRPLSDEELREMIAPVLGALQFIHTERLAHGRIKPSNILAFGDQIKISSDSLFESTAGASAEDIRMLGMTIIESLTQRRDERLASTLPAPFDRIARDCMQADPMQRPVPAAIAASLRPPSPVEVPEKHVPGEETRPHKTGIPVLAAVGLGLLAIIVGTAVLRHSSSPPEKPPATEVRAAPAPAPPPPVIEPARAGEVVYQVLPEISRQARDTIHGTVNINVKASVDTTGRVTDATLSSSGPSKYLAKLTLAAARRWEFRPPRAQGKDIPSKWLLRFDLTRSATTVHPAELPR